jgi:anti-sigma B factor antagonist
MTDLHEELGLRLTAMRVGRWSYSLAAAGEIDLYSAPDLEQALELVPPDVRHVLVDLSGVSFVDSVGLATLVTASRRFAGRGAQMLLVVDDPRIRRVLEVTGLDRFFGVRTSADTATRELVGASVLESLGDSDAG